MGGSLSTNKSTVTAESIANILVQAFVQSSSNASTDTTTVQTGTLNISNSKGVTFTQNADISSQLNATINNSTDTQLQTLATSALSAAAAQQATTSSSIGINASTNISDVTTKAITNVSQTMSVQLLSSCRSSIRAEQSLAVNVVSSESINLSQTITINQVATCMLSNSAFSSAATQLATQMNASSSQTATASLFSSELIYAALAACVLCSLVSAAGAYLTSKSENGFSVSTPGGAYRIGGAGSKEGFRSITSNKFMRQRPRHGSSFRPY